MSSFAFRVCQWLERTTASSEENDTYCELVVEANGTPLTQVHDVGARTVHDGIRVAASTLAQWLAWNRWRLLHDVSQGAPGDVDWRLAHCLAAAGGGYVWPAMEFTSDGDFVRVQQSATSGSRLATITYLRNANEHVERLKFEHAVDDFLTLVQERLVATGHSKSETVGLIRAVQDECADNDVSSLRRLEAQLKLDPDTIEASLLRGMRDGFAWAGSNALQELAAVSSVRELPALAEWARAQEHKTSGMWKIDRDVVREMSELTASASQGELPWERGRSLAWAVRRKLGAGLEPLRVRDVLRVAPASKSSSAIPRELQAAAFVRQDGHLSAFVQGTRATAVDFQLARVLAGAILNNGEECMLPCTMSHSARQKTQRAFAQELLCPIEGLLAFVRTPGEPQESEVESAAIHFGVSQWTVQTALVNHGYTPREFLPLG
jgi:hypothetical protein